MPCDCELVADGASSFDQLVLIAAGECALERGAELAAFRVRFVVGFELRFDSLGVDGSVVVVDEVVGPQDVRAFRVVLRVRSLRAGRVIHFSLGQFRFVLGLDAQLGRRTGE
eukprot:2487353-Pleurochrysis_carterae.AAC.2